jgi:hypothetical protein
VNLKLSLITSILELVDKSNVIDITIRVKTTERFPYSRVNLKNCTRITRLARRLRVVVMLSSVLLNHTFFKTIYSNDTKIYFSKKIYLILFETMCVCACVIYCTIDAKKSIKQQCNIFESMHFHRVTTS